MTIDAVFAYDNYKDYLKAALTSGQAQRGFQSRMAEAAGCQRSYLSQVLKGHQHLTLEHVLGISDFLRLDGLESDYFLELVHLERAGTLRLKRHYKRRLQRLKQEAQKVSRKLLNPKAGLSLEQLQLYYSSWHYCVIHTALSIPGCDSALHIAQMFGLAATQVEQVLDDLELMGLAGQNTEGAWKLTKGGFHLPHTSPLGHQHHQNMRLLAMQRAPCLSHAVSGEVAGNHRRVTEEGNKLSQGCDTEAADNTDEKEAKENENRDLRFSAAISVSVKDGEKIKDILLEAIGRISKVVASSPAEEVVLFNIDWMPAKVAF